MVTILYDISFTYGSTARNEKTICIISGWERKQIVGLAEIVGGLYFINLDVSASKYRTSKSTEIPCTTCYRASFGKHLLQNIESAADRRKNLVDVSSEKLSRGDENYPHSAQIHVGDNT